jgi:hypothetical protein
MGKWTEKELAALDECSDASMGSYHKFGGLTDYSRSYTAFEIKRRRRAEADITASLIPATNYGPPERLTEAFYNGSYGGLQTFVGFTMAYWDLETTFSNQPIVLYGAIANQFGEG